MTTDKFGRYEIKSEIGRGGMATVYHAYDPRFERDVAIKVLPHEFLHDPQFRVRFDREAKMIALLEHPAIVPVYDFGEEDGQPYIVMRYMSGGSLADRLKGKALPVQDAVQIIARLAPALDAAHSKGIIHRDLKPGNVLFDQYDNAFLSDFGIARLGQASASTLTGTSVLGTPAYMSPEQVQGDKDIDGRSDIYALGVILYQMLTGSTPYHADSPAKVMMMQVLEPVPHIMNVRKDISPAIDYVIEQAMAKDPDQRTPTAGEMASAALAAAEGIEAAHTPTQPGATVVAPSKTRPKTSPPLAATVVKAPVIPSQRPAGPVPIPIAPAAPQKNKFPIWLLLVGGLLFFGLVAVFAAGGTFLATAFGNKQTPSAIAAVVTNTPLVVVATTQVPILPTLTFTLIPPTDTLVPTTLASNTPQPIPTDTPPAPTSTPAPSDTPLPVVSAPTLGGADKIALLDGKHNLWVMNVDGSEPQQLTVDNGAKDNLQWTPDGQSIVFTSGNCVKIVDFATGRIDDITCFTAGEPNALKAFQISPDGTQVAISFLSELFIVPYKLDVLKSVDRISRLKANAVCDKIAPYASTTGTAIAVKWVQWSTDMQHLAVDFLGIDGNRQADMIDVLNISSCSSGPYREDQFPGTRFTISGYNETPRIENFSFNGESLFLLTGGRSRNGGFGDLYLYNSELHKGQMINPLSGCCYRDPSWSPNGSYLAFVFQDISLGEGNTTQIFLISYGSLGTGVTYTPIPLPANFFTNKQDHPSPALRPAK